MVNQDEAIRAILDRDQDAVLAIVLDINGPSYRPIGTMMSIFGKNDYIGSLSSGCVEADLTIHAHRALQDNCLKVVKYGLGSPYIDIQLPCGGGLEVLLLPRPDETVLTGLIKLVDARKDVSLSVDTDTGKLSVTSNKETLYNGSTLDIYFEPEILFFVFGSGPEAVSFSSLAISTGHKLYLLSPDAETLAKLNNTSCFTQKLKQKTIPDDVVIDKRSAIILFFHDHDWEPSLLLDALATDAFYIGAQGSLQARDTRFKALKQLGAADEQLARLYGPIGLIPSARDPVTLAVSVMAEVISKSNEPL